MENILFKDFNLSTLTPETKTEESILEDLKELQMNQNNIPILFEEIKDDPDYYPYTEDDLTQYLYKHNISY